jgi:glutaminyl-peptide cyclotransferase
VIPAALLLFLAQASASIHFDANRAWEHLRRVVAIGPRPAGSAAIEESRRYIKTTLAAAGVSVSEQAWTDRTPLGPVRMVNLIATIPGASANRLVIAGHYDTKLVREFRFVGANDGGSSTAFLLELARALKARRNALTIELVFFDGEEAVVEWAGTDNTYGSRRYVSVTTQNGSLATLKAMILVDMIADRDLLIMRESHSTPWLADIIWDAARRQKLGPYFDDEGMPIEDDHLPFLEAGIPAVDLIDFEFKAWHTAADTLDAVSSRGLQVVGDTLLAALPAIEARLR